MDNSTKSQVEQLLKIIDSSVEKIQFSEQKEDTESLFYLGNWHESIPLFIYRDPILESVDRNVYGVIRSLTSKESATAFPTYDDICKYGNISSHATVARSVAILRLVRWSTQRLVRCPLSGQIRRKVYIMHDQPLELADTIQLDPGYMSYMEDCLTHHHAYVQKVAKLVMNSIQKNINAGKDISENEHHLTRQNESATYWNESSSSYFGFTRDEINTLKNTSSKETEPTSIIEVSNTLENEDRQTSINEVTLTSNFEEHSSSSFLNSPTTTDVAIGKNPPKIKTYQFTPFLQELFSSNEKRLVQMQLATLPDQYRQLVINQLSNRIEHGDKEVSKPISLLSWYCNELKAGRTPLTEYSLSDFSPETDCKKHLPQSRKSELDMEISNIRAEIIHAEKIISMAKASEKQPEIEFWENEKYRLKQKINELRGVYPVPVKKNHG